MIKHVTSLNVIPVGYMEPVDIWGCWVDSETPYVFRIPNCQKRGDGSGWGYINFDMNDDPVWHYLDKNLIVKGYSLIPEFIPA